MDLKSSQRIGLSVLGLSFTFSLFGRGLQESFSVFLLPISQSFGWDRSEVVSIYSLTALCVGLSSPLIGRLFDRSGPRTVFVVGLSVLGLSLLAAAYAKHLWQFQLALGACFGFAVACIGNVPNALLLGRWFGKRLPLAMSVFYLRHRRRRPGDAAACPASDRSHRVAWRLPQLRHDCAGPAAPYCCLGVRSARVAASR